MPLHISPLANLFDGLCFAMSQVVSLSHTFVQLTYLWHILCSYTTRPWRILSFSSARTRPLLCSDRVSISCLALGGILFSAHLVQVLLGSRQTIYHGMADGAIKPKSSGSSQSKGNPGVAPSDLTTFATPDPPLVPSGFFGDRSCTVLPVTDLGLLAQGVWSTLELLDSGTTSHLVRTEDFFWSHISSAARSVKTADHGDLVRASDDCLVHLSTGNQFIDIQLCYCLHAPDACVNPFSVGRVVANGVCCSSGDGCVTVSRGGKALGGEKMIGPVGVLDIDYFRPPTRSTITRSPSLTAHSNISDVCSSNVTRCSSTLIQDRPLPLSSGRRSHLVGGNGACAPEGFVSPHSFPWPVPTSASGPFPVITPLGDDFTNSIVIRSLCVDMWRLMRFRCDGGDNRDLPGLPGADHQTFVIVATSSPGYSASPFDARCVLLCVDMLGVKTGYVLLCAGVLGVKGFRCDGGGMLSSALSSAHKESIDKLATRILQGRILAIPTAAQLLLTRRGETALNAAHLFNITTPRSLVTSSLTRLIIITIRAASTKHPRAFGLWPGSRFSWTGEIGWA